MNRRVTWLPSGERMIFLKQPDEIRPRDWILFALAIGMVIAAYGIGANIIY